MSGHSRFHKKGKARVEVGTFNFQGRDFSALGSVRDPERGVLVGYVKKVENPKPGESHYQLTSWDGKEVLAQLRRLSTWKTPRSFVSSTMSSWVTTVDGVRYSGRGAGEGMLLKMKAGKRGRRG